MHSTTINKQHPTARTSASAMSMSQLQETHAALSNKVRQQAAELTETLDVLQETQRYVEILEERLLQAVPDHPFPVTEEHLRQPIVSKQLTSSLRTNTNAISSNNTTGNSPTNTRASISGQQSSATLELSSQVTELRAKLEDAQRRFREAHTAIDRKEKERLSIANKCAVLAKRVGVSFLFCMVWLVYFIVAILSFFSFFFSSYR